jgi:purine-binding chemotaxis protein CheW
MLLDAQILLLGKKEENPEKQEQKTQVKLQTEMKQVEESNQTINDIPPELAAVFAEDEQGIAPAQIIREDTS